jgi:hypothetical protein
MRIVLLLDEGGSYRDIEDTSWEHQHPPSRNGNDGIKKDGVLGLATIHPGQPPQKGYLHQAVREREAQPHSTPSSFVGAEFEEGLHGIAWISKNCGCKAELAEIEAYARAQQQDAPEVRKFLAGLAAIQEQK